MQGLNKSAKKTADSGNLRERIKNVEIKTYL